MNLLVKLCVNVCVSQIEQITLQFHRLTRCSEGHFLFIRLCVNYRTSYFTEVEVLTSERIPQHLNMREFTDVNSIRLTAAPAQTGPSYSYTAALYLN